MVPIALDDLPPVLKDKARLSPSIEHLREVLIESRKGDDGRTTVVFTFVLAEPPEDMATWPVEELWALRRVAREVVPEAIARAIGQAAEEVGATVDDLPPLDWAIEFKPDRMTAVAPDDLSLEFEV